ncbi:MAG: GNAT family N-acetyltransferase [Cytophagales bacterium]|nr:GNAT family N-acetyltransferase [Cytophagales bacterium]
MEVKEIRSKDIAAYKAFFGKGLVEDEANFRISPDDEQEAPFPTLDAPDSFTLGAFEGGRLAGIVSFQREGRDRRKLRHKGLLFRMYVDPQFRGKGVGRALIEALRGRVETLGDVEQINLTVVSNNPVAKKLYEQFGFVSFAVEKNALKWKGRYYTEEQMVLFLSHADVAEGKADEK